MKLHGLVNASDGESVGVRKMARHCREARAVRVGFDYGENAGAFCSFPDLVEVGDECVKSYERPRPACHDQVSSA